MKITIKELLKKKDWKYLNVQIVNAPSCRELNGTVGMLVEPFLGLEGHKNSVGFVGEPKVTRWVLQANLPPNTEVEILTKEDV